MIHVSRAGDRPVLPARTTVLTRLTTAGAALLLALGLVLTVPLSPTGAQQPRERAPQPVTGHSFADPSVLPLGGELLAISTGLRAPGAVSGSGSPVGHWRATGPLLHHLPHWVARGPIWAADAAHVGRRWVMYYAAPVRGVNAGARCIGVAVSHHPTRGFDARGRKPLVCPAGAHARRADDRVLGRARTLPHSGVIDPSFFHRGRHAYLLYRTQRTPATIRLVRLHHHGLRAAHRSHQILRVPHIVENPVLVRRGARYVLFTSQGYFGSCGYQTTWRASRSLLHFGDHGHQLLTDRRTRVCGPGGLDVADRHLVFFHGWVCGSAKAGSRRCRYGRHVDIRGGAHRTMYAGRLRWRHGRPHIHALHA